MQGVGWRQSRACGNAPRLARTRPFPICSLGSYLMRLPHWTDARRGRQQRRPRSILRPTASRSPAFVSASHSSTTSLRRTLKSASQTQGAGSYLRISGLPTSASHSNGKHRFQVLRQFGVDRPKIGAMLPVGKANCGASTCQPQNGSFCVQAVRGNGAFPARRLQVAFGAPECRIVEKALTRN